MVLKLASSAVLALALAGAVNAQQPQKLTGIAAWSKLVGNTVVGRIDGKDYVDYYLADGTVKALEDSKLTTGKWTLEGLNVCFAHRGPKECYAVEVADDVATFTPRGGGAAYRVKVLQGNPRNL
jgi:hypothetical protein